MLRIIILSFTLLFNVALLAQTKAETINLAFIDVSTADFADGKTLMEDLRRTIELKGRKCWVCEKDEKYGVWFLYLFRLPPGITPGLALSAAEGGKVQIKEVQKLLAAFKDPADGQTIDALIVFQHSHSELNLYAIPNKSTGKDKVFHELKDLSGGIMLEDLDQLIEKLSKKIK